MDHDEGGIAKETLTHMSNRHLIPALRDHESMASRASGAKERSQLPHSLIYGVPVGGQPQHQKTISLSQGPLAKLGVAPDYNVDLRSAMNSNEQQMQVPDRNTSLTRFHNFLNVIANKGEEQVPASRSTGRFLGGLKSSGSQSQLHSKTSSNYNLHRYAQNQDDLDMSEDDDYQHI